MPDFLRARELAEAVQTAVRGNDAASPALSGSRRRRSSRRSRPTRRKPGGITVVLPGNEGAFLGPLAGSEAAGGRAAKPRSASPRVGIEDRRRPRRARRRHASRAAARARSAACCATAPAALDARRLVTDVARISISQEETFPRDIDDRAPPARRAEAYGRRPGRASPPETGRSARTVTTKVRYPDFSTDAIVDARRCGRRRRHDRRCRLSAPRPRPGGPPGRASPRGRRRARPGRARPAGDRLGLQLLDRPAAARAAVREADVQPVLAVLPELERVRRQPVPAPEPGPGRPPRRRVARSAPRTCASSSSREATGSL